MRSQLIVVRLFLVLFFKMSLIWLYLADYTHFKAKFCSAVSSCSVMSADNVMVAPCAVWLPGLRFLFGFLLWFNVWGFLILWYYLTTYGCLIYRGSFIFWGLLILWGSPISCSRNFQQGSGTDYILWCRLKLCLVHFIYKYKFICKRVSCPSKVKNLWS